MKKTRGKYISAYRKERKRILNFIRRAEKRGYEFKKSIIPKLLKKPTKASVEKLKKLTPEKLYEKATYKLATGKTIKGTEARKLERSISAKKSAETRRRGKKKEAVPSIVFVVLQKIQQLINDARATEHKYSADHLDRILNQEIMTFGMEEVAMALYNTPYYSLELAETALMYNPGSVRHESSIYELLKIIRGNANINNEFDQIIKDDEVDDFEEF